MRGVALAALAAGVLVAGCAGDTMLHSASSGGEPIRITSIEQVTGRWYSCYNDHGVSVLSLTISSDGLAKFAFHMNPTLTYYLEPRDGMLYLKYLGCSARPCPGEGSPVRVLEARGKQHISFTGGPGSSANAIWVECARPAK